MSKPVIFLSSVIYELDHLRDGISKFIDEMGYRAIRSDEGDIPYRTDEELQKTCYRLVSEADIVVGVIHKRFGSTSDNPEFSITQREILTAIELGKQTYVFVLDSVASEYRSYKNASGNFTPAHVDDIKVYTFLDLIYSEEYVQKVVLHNYSKVGEICDWLRKQWAGLFKDAFSARINRTLSAKDPADVILLEVENIQNHGGKSRTILWYKGFFSDYLFFRGKLNERIKLGSLAYDAALRISSKEEQVKVLIDELGWSWICLKEYENGQTFINEGLELTLDDDNLVYYRAKAKRHLAAVLCETNKLDEAEQLLQEVLTIADKIGSKTKRNQMLFGVYYGLARVQILQREFSEALKSILKARELAKTLKNEHKLISTYSLEGKILELMGSKLWEAHRVFASGVEMAEQANLTDEAIRNYAGIISCQKKMGNAVGNVSYKDKALKLLNTERIQYEVGDNIFNINRLVRNNEKHITLFRHGLSAKNLKKIIGGVGTPLELDGTAQLDKFCDNYLSKNWQYDIIIHSGRPQCQQTAEYISKKINVPFKESALLEPIHMGVIDGKSEEEVQRDHHDIYLRLQRWREQHIEAHELNIPGSGDLREFYERGVKLLKDCLIKYDSILVIGTSSTMILLANIILDRKVNKGGRYKSITFSNSDYLTYAKTEKYKFIKSFSSIQIPDVEVR